MTLTASCRTLNQRTMRQPEIKPLLQELIDGDVSLEKSANILWQWKKWEEAKEEERYAYHRDADIDTMSNLIQTSKRNRLQLEHYMVEANISDALIDAIIRPQKT